MMDNLELRKKILQLIYVKGYRYIARDSNGDVYTHTSLPTKKTAYWDSEEAMTRLYFLDKLFGDVTFEDEEPFSIEKALGIVDWSTIPEDTKVLVSFNGWSWIRRYFKEYRKGEENPFFVYHDGRTSWSGEDFNPYAYKYCKLAEEE